MDPIFSRIQSTEGYGAQKGVKILVYGLAGMGKTTLCATAPSPIILSAESGLLALARYNLPYLEVKTLQDLRDYFNWANSSNECRKNFQTICIDSISEIAEVVLGATKVKVKDGRMAYGEMIDQMNAIIKNYRDLAGYHVYMSAKQERIKDDITGVVVNQPAMPGAKLGQNVPYLPDEVFKLDIEGFGAQSYRLLRTQPDLMNVAKDRSGVLNPIEEPHLGKIIDKITSAQKLSPGT